MLKNNETKQSTTSGEKQVPESTEDRWSELPPELLTIIKHKLVLSGNCLNLFPEYAFPVDNSPLLLYKRSVEDDVLHYYSPVFNRSFIVSCPVDLSNTELRLQSNGWLLLSRRLLGVLLVNPLAGISYKLPDININSLVPLDVCAFSVPPSLPLPENFIIFSVFCAHTMAFICIYINGGWTEDKYHESSYPFELSCSTPVYRNGLFYCFSLIGNIATYNPVTDEWICNDKPRAIDRSVIGNVYSSSFVEIKGEFVSVFQNEERNKLNIWKLNEEINEWEICSNCVLGNNTALFMDYPRSIVSEVWGRGLRNKIVFTKVFGEEEIIHAEIKVFQGRIYFVNKTTYLMDTMQEHGNEKDEKKGVCCCSFANAVEYDFEDSNEFVFSIWYEAKL